jgi:tripeptide aminopeptidase
VSTAGGVVELFCDLAAISSPSRDERAVADAVLERLRGIGLDPVEDDSGARTGSNIGNIHVALPATD